MKYLSVCSGIEAATVAWHPLGWEPIAFSEVDAFPSAVLKHHYPSVPNWGDMTRYKEWPDATLDLLVGGTPCQSFSVAGLRKGLSDPRGNLALTFLALADRYRPRWVVWENVPGVLSADSHDSPDPCPPPQPLDLGCDGAEVDTEDEYDADEVHAFACLLAGFSELGYHGAYGTLDAQFFNLAQRRARVFAVFNLGDWRRAAAVLFDRESLSGHPAPRREAGQGVTAGALRSTDGGSDVEHGRAGHLIPSTGAISHCLNAGGMGRIDYETETLITHALRADGFDASEDGTGRGTPLVAVANALGANAGRNQVEQTYVPVSFSVNGGVMPAVAFDLAQITSPTHRRQPSEVAGALSSSGRESVAQPMAVRRLTPQECERLQGFPCSRNQVRIDVCFDHPNDAASVALSCRRSLANASPVDDERSLPSVVSAVGHSSTHRVGREPDVLVRVRTQSVGELLELRSHGKSMWSAESAAGSSASLLPTERESIAAVVALHAPVLVTEILAGRVVSPVSMTRSIPAVNGEARATTSGDASAESVNAASGDVQSERFTTSDLGRLTPKEDSTAAISLCSVLGAISGCIQNETLGECFSVEIDAETPYTLIPYRGKPAADGPRYKALGNSMAVPCMSWIVVNGFRP